MDGSSSALALALALAATGLAGCIENPNWLNTDDVEVSAFANKELADDAARAWNPDAVLVGAMAFELSQSEDARITEDPDPGNGYAPAWWYAYSAKLADESEVRAWKVSADGTLTSEDEANGLAATMDHDLADAIQNWHVDSDDALATAKTDEAFRTVAEGFNATVVEGVAHIEGISQWWVSAISADGFVVAMIDADTGELLAVQPMDLDFEIPAFAWGAGNPDLAVPPVHVEGEGALRGGEMAEYPFHLATGMGGVLEASAHSSMPFGAVYWAILDDEGEEVEEGSLGSYRGMDADAFELDLDAGDYTLAFYAQSFLPETPLADGSEYAFMLHLEPGYEPEAEDDER